MAARKLKRSEYLPETSSWELLVRLAQGGMGAVFLGTRRGTREPVFAIKRAHAHLLEEPEFRKMFTAEAQLALRIHHLHAIGVRAVDETDGELLLIMDYFEGGSFGELLTAAHESGVKLPTGVVLRIVLDAARGLDAAHRLTDERGQPLGIVHRDVSPQNILVGITGTSAIVDFGVAKAAAVEATRTATEVLKGKTAYMAPEYLKSRAANAQTDVFSLGVVAWEALAGRRLFKREDEVSTMQAILGPEAVPMLVDLMPFDAKLSAIIARSLTREPRQRYQAASEFADALESHAATMELLATRGEVAATVKRLLGEGLEERRALVADALTQRYGMQDISASARMTNRMPLASETERPSGEFGDSHPFQVMDTPRRRAMTAPTPIIGGPATLIPGSATVSTGPPTMTAASLTAPVSITAAVPTRPLREPSPRIPLGATVQLPPSPAFALNASGPRATLPLQAVAPLEVGTRSDAPSTQATFVAASLPVAPPSPRSSRAGLVVGGLCAAALVGGIAAVGLFGLGSTADATPELATPPELATTAEASAAPPQLPASEPSSAARPEPSQVDPETAAPAASVSVTTAEATAPVAATSSAGVLRTAPTGPAAPKPTSTGWRPKSNPYK